MTKKKKNRQSPWLRKLDREGALFGNEGQQPIRTIRIERDVLIEPVSVHRHDYMDFVFVRSGRGIERINGQDCEMRHGYASMLMPWHIHELLPQAGEPVHSYRLSVSYAQAFALIEYINNAKLTDLSIFTPVLAVYFDDEAGYAHMEENLRQILAEVENPGPFSEQIKRACLLNVLSAFLTRIFIKNNGAGTKGQAMERIFTYLNTHYAADITIEDAAREFGLSVGQVNDVVQEELDLSFSELLHEIRVRNSCVLLANSEYTVEAIAKMCGYRSPQTYYKAFATIKGMAPGEYRQTCYASGQKEDVTVLPHVVWEIIYYLHANFTEDLSAAEVAARFHISASRFRDLLRLYTHQTFSEMLAEVRIIHACARLRATAEPVTDIAYSTGFNSVRTFNRVFLAARGCTPAAYRAN